MESQPSVVRLTGILIFIYALHIRTGGGAKCDREEWFLKMGGGRVAGYVYHVYNKFYLIIHSISSKYDLFPQI